MADIEITMMRRELDKRAWRRRLTKALEDGLAIEGDKAVYTAVQEVLADLGVKAPRGAREKPMPPSMLEAARLWIRDPQTRSADLARAAGISDQDFAYWSSTPRWAGRKGEAWAEMLDEEPIDRLCEALEKALDKKVEENGK